MKTITKIKKLMSKNEEYYSIRNILDTESEYNMLLGERSNGKSYSVKEFVLLCAYNLENYKFGYLRRWREEIKSVKVENYFTDINHHTNLPDFRQLSGWKYLRRIHLPELLLLHCLKSFRQ